MAAVERLVGMTHDVLRKVMRLRRPARGNVVWFGGRLGNVAISAPDLNQEWSCSLPHLRVPSLSFCWAFVVGGGRPGNLDQLSERMLESALKSIILSPNKSYPSPHQREPILLSCLPITTAPSSPSLSIICWSASRGRAARCQCRSSDRP